MFVVIAVFPTRLWGPRLWSGSLHWLMTRYWTSYLSSYRYVYEYVFVWDHTVLALNIFICVTNCVYICLLPHFIRCSLSVCVCICMCVSVHRDVHVHWLPQLSQVWLSLLVCVCVWVGVRCTSVCFCIPVWCWLTVTLYSVHHLCKFCGNELDILCGECMKFQSICSIHSAVLEGC